MLCWSELMNRKFAGSIQTPVVLFEGHCRGERLDGVKPSPLKLPLGGALVAFLSMVYWPVVMVALWDAVTYLESCGLSNQKQEL